MSEQPQKGVVTASDLAERLGKSERWVQLKAKEGVIIRAGHGKYILGQSLLNLIKHYESLATKAAESPAGYDGELLDKEQEQARSAREDWMRKGMDRLERMQVLLDAQVAREQWGHQLQEIARDMDTLPDDIERQLPNIDPDVLDTIVEIVDEWRSGVAAKMAENQSESDQCSDSLEKLLQIYRVSSEPPSD